MTSLGPEDHSHLSPGRHTQRCALGRRPLYKAENVPALRGVVRSRPRCGMRGRRRGRALAVQLGSDVKFQHHRASSQRDRSSSLNPKVGAEEPLSHRLPGAHILNNSEQCCGSPRSSVSSDSKGITSLLHLEDWGPGNSYQSPRPATAKSTPASARAGSRVGDRPCGRWLGRLREDPRCCQSTVGTLAKQQPDPRSHSRASWHKLG